MTESRWHVLGADGMLGKDLIHTLRERGVQVFALTRHEADVTDPHACARAVEGADVVVNCAAYTAVDDAEHDEGSAFAVNALGAANVARAANLVGARLVHVSTDYVFSGIQTSPIPENSITCPQSAYGRSKAAGEWAVQAYSADHIIVRTAWLYGEHGACFPKTIARLLKTHETISVVQDQIGQPTWTVDLAELIFRLVQRRAPVGIFHGTSSGDTSWLGFARAIAAATGAATERVQPARTRDFPRPATRPAFSVLGHQRLDEIQIAAIRPWHERWRAAASVVLANELKSPPQPSL